MNGKIKIALIIILALALAFGIYYVNDYYHADKVAADSLNNDSNVTVVESSNGLLLDGPGNDTALIFYPGAKVEYTSYAPLFKSLSSKGIDCYLVEMPFNLAILGQNSADDILNSGNYSHYFISGHSLGGSMAASYVNSTNNTDGLILFAAYPTADIEKPALSLYGSNDNVLNMEKYDESKGFYKSNFTEFVIDGGNHAEFGDYGIQSGDGMATISAQSQQNQSVNEILQFIEGVLG